MLNELWRLARSNFSPAGDRHKHYQPCPNASLWVARINRGGEIAELELWDKEKAVQVNKWAPSNFYSFPVINITTFYIIRPKTIEYEKWMTLLERIQDSATVFPTETAKIEIRSMLQTLPSAWRKKEIISHRRALIESPGMFIAALGFVNADSNIHGPQAVVFELIERMKAFKEWTYLRDQLIATALKLLDENRVQAAQVLKNLVVGTAKSNGVESKTQILFDLYSLTGEPRIIYPEVDSWINQALLESEFSSAGGECVEDAFGEKSPAKSLQELMPNVNVPILGPIKLRALNKDAPCQNRYKMTGPGSFPVGLSARRRMKAAVDGLLTRENRGKTWEDISLQSEFKERAILCAYVPERSDLGAGMSFIRLISASEDLDDQTDAIKHAAINRVFKTLQGVARERPYLEICTFALVKLDKARTKIVCPHRFSAEVLFRAVENWRRFGNNLPKNRLVIYSEKKAEIAGGVVPAPIEVAGLVNTTWINEGTTSRKEQWITVDEGFSLFLSFGGASRAPYKKILQRAVSNALPFVISIKARIEVNGSRMKYTPKEKEYFQKMPALWAILLAGIGRKGDMYMQNTAYLLGRMFALVDTLHKEYLVRDGQSKLPANLLGNQHVRHVCKDPVKGLAMLSQRLPVYQAWAATNGSGLARWALSELGKVAQKLTGLEIPKRLDDAGQAEFLLGYLARSERSEE